MIASHRLFTTAMSLLVFAAFTLSASALTFSVSAPSATVAPAVIMNEDDLANPGPVVLFPGSGPPVGGSGIEVNAFSYGRLGAPGLTAIFSVAPPPAGIPGTAVAFEAGAGDHPADVYSSFIGSGFNTQLWDGDGIVAAPPTPGAPSPPLGLFEPFSSALIDDLDAVDGRFAPTPLPGLGPTIFWSVDPFTYGGGFSADIFFGPAAAGYAAGPAPYVAAAGIGLVGGAAGDDIDALVYFEDGVAGATPGDVILFSLAAGSPTLGGGAFAGPGDILITAPGGAPGIFALAGTIGLLPGDELNALDIIPEPGVSALILVGLLGAIRRRR